MPSVNPVVMDEVHAHQLGLTRPPDIDLDFVSLVGRQDEVIAVAHPLVDGDRQQIFFGIAQAETRDAGADAEVLCKGVTSARAEAAVCVVYHADPSRPLVALNAGAGADGVPTLNLHYHAPP